VRLEKRKDLLGLRDLEREEIEVILDTAVPMKDIIQRDIKKVPALRGKAMVTVFYENSTRTRTSFEIAGKYLSADTVNLAVSTSSVQKGESLRDTIKTIEVMGFDLMVIRHSMSEPQIMLPVIPVCGLLMQEMGPMSTPPRPYWICTVLERKRGLLKD